MATCSSVNKLYKKDRKLFKQLTVNTVYLFGGYFCKHLTVHSYWHSFKTAMQTFNSTQLLTSFEDNSCIVWPEIEGCVHQFNLRTQSITVLLYLVYAVLLLTRQKWGWLLFTTYNLSAGIYSNTQYVKHFNEILNFIYNCLCYKDFLSSN